MVAQKQPTGVTGPQAFLIQQLAPSEKDTSPFTTPVAILLYSTFNMKNIYQNINHAQTSNIQFPQLDATLMQFVH